jgi:putative transposase
MLKTCGSDLGADAKDVTSRVIGFWKALAEVFPEARHQRCWVHEIANVANAFPKSTQPGAKKALREICNAEDRGLAAAGMSVAWG